MKTLILAAIRCSLMFLLPTGAYAISSQWDLDPISGDWNTADNWTPMGVPNGPADTATFAFSNTINVSISANTEVNGITFTSAATTPYTISVGNSPLFVRQLELSGVGITNNSGTMQNFVTVGNASGSPCAILFANSATAGSLTTFRNMGGNGVLAGAGETLFFDTASAGNATFVNHGGTLALGITEFNGSSTAANGTFINNEGGVTRFLFSSTTAANGTFINNGGTSRGAFGGATVLVVSTGANGVFTNNGASASGAFGGLTSIAGGTAANAIVTNNGASISGAGGGRTIFFGGTAGNAIITNNGATVSGAGGGLMFFTESSTAGNARLIANGGMGGGQGGMISFENNATGGTSRIEVFGNGDLDISAHDAPRVTIGSVEGDGNVFLGANDLTVGSSNLSTIFSGVILDGGQRGGVGGFLTKIGTGTLILAGANTYTGNTNVSGGVLQVDGSITSDTFVHPSGKLAGTGTIYANLDNKNGGKVSPGDAPGALTVVHNYTQAQYATLMIQIAGTSAGDFSVLNVLGNASLNGNLDPVLLNGFIPTIGESFVFLNYASFTGAFSQILNQVFSHGTEQWAVIYQNNNAILTVEAHTPVPDQGSTLLLLAFGLLCLMTYRKTRIMNPSIQLTRTISVFLLMVASFWLLPAARAVNPPPDGDYPNQNTAEGDNALLNLTSGGNNTALGFNALLNDTTGFRNTATGSRALTNNTTGAQNTATGNEALVANTTGSQNTATGVQTLQVNSTGAQNTANGFQALFSNRAGSGNTANGFQTLFRNRGGGNNTANGSQALYGNTMGFENTASGFQALYSNTTAIQNTATGAHALYSNTVGDANTANGDHALFSNTVGYGNTATGSEALFNSNGLQNTANGWRALYSNTTGEDNTAIGVDALVSNTTGFSNTATGLGTLAGNTTGQDNTATGFAALERNTTGSSNTANGVVALVANTAGDSNVANGSFALVSNTSGSNNTASGVQALQNNTTGNNNTALGTGAGNGVTTANNVICIGSSVDGANVSDSCFIGNIHGVTTVNNDAIPVVIDSAGQLGTASSSARFKKEIKPMDNASEIILGLKPVTFHYKNDKTDTPQFGLIAEEVAKVNPDLVVRDKNGEIYSVRYDAVNAMLLNEFLKEHGKLQNLQATITHLKSTVEKQQAANAQQQKQIEALTAGLQKVSAQLEASKTAPQVVNNNQ